jgi:hypothetical protein
VIRYANGAIAEQANDATLPPGLLKTGAQAQNEVRLVCKPSTDSQHTNVYLFLNGKQVSNAEASVGGAGKVGLLVGSSSGATEFTFSEFVAKKPK